MWKKTVLFGLLSCTAMGFLSPAQAQEAPPSPGVEATAPPTNLPANNQQTNNQQTNQNAAIAGNQNRLLQLSNQLNWQPQVRVEANFDNMLRNLFNPPRAEEKPAPPIQSPQIQQPQNQLVQQPQDLRSPQYPTEQTQAPQQYNPYAYPPYYYNPYPYPYPYPQTSYRYPSRRINPGYFYSW